MPEPPCESLGLVRLLERHLAVEVARREALERRVERLEAEATRGAPQPPADALQPTPTRCPSDRGGRPMPRRCEICLSPFDVRAVGAEEYTPVRLCADCRREDRRLDERFTCKEATMFPITMTAEQLQAFNDAIFDFVEAHEGTAARGFTEGVRMVVDRAGIPALYSELVAKGFLVAPK